MSSKTSLAVLLFLCIALPFALAQKAGEKPAPPPQDFSKEAVVIEHLSTRVTMENDGTGTREATAEVKMLAEAGVKAYAVLNFVYTSANEVVDVDYVRVRKPDGTVVKTPDYNIQDMPGEVTRTAPLYSDIHEKHVAVKGLAVGDTLEYLIRFRTVKPEVPGQFWYEYYFATKSIIKDERLELSVPREKYVKVVSPDFKPEVKEEGARRVYRWTHENLVVKEKDPNEMPRRTLPNSHVQVTTFTSWEEVGRWYGDLQKEPLTVTPAVQAKAADLTKGLTTDIEKIHAIYNFVSLKFHYIGLDFGIGRYQPHAADDVLDNGYGDCKDKHTLLASLLKAAGYDAWPALINGARNLDPDVPSPAQFNHVITVVPLGEPIWLDTSPEVAPYRLLIAQLRDKQALVIPTNKPALLMKTPENPPFPLAQEFSSSGKLGSDGTYTGHMEQSYRGDTEVLLRMAFRQLSESQWKDAVQRFSQAMNFGGDVSNVKVSPPDELDKPFEISYDYVRKKFGDWEDDNTSAALAPLGVEFGKNDKEKKLLEPYFLGAPGTIVHRSRMELPSGYSVVPSARCHETTSFAEYTATTVFEDGVITTNRELIVKKSEVPISEWANYRKFGQAVSDDEFGFMRLNHVGGAVVATIEAGKEDDSDDETPDDEEGVDLTFRQGANALQRSDNKRAEELFEKVIAKNPKYKGAHFSLGIALASQNKTTEAIAEFHKEQELFPQDLKNYQAPATYLSMTGHTEEAIAEWRKMLKADPENRDAALYLSNLLRQTGKYTDAAEVLEGAVKASPDSPSLQLALGQAYMKSKQAEKAVPHLLEAAEKKQDDPGVLNEVAYALADNNTNLDVARKYAEKAVSELDEQAQSSESSNEAGLNVTYLLSITWDTLGWIYFQQGDAKRAEGFIRPSWLLSEHSVVAEHLGEIYEKEGKTQLAAHAYEWALAVSSAPAPGVTIAMMGPQSQALKESQREAIAITARYKKITGKEPDLRSMRRLPNGEWTKTPAEQLRQTREVKLSNDGKISGSAQFLVVFKPGKVDSAEFVTGDEELKPLSDKLQSAHYPLEFPPDSGASLVMQVNVYCRPGAPCTGTLINPVPGGRQFPAVQSAIPN
jgi:tetratricopeptide (TPR) repeat protein/transglutaminase-like putative cysteine protease